MILSQLKNLLKTKEFELRALHVKKLFVFGSVARGSAESTSDIDLLVEFDCPVGMFEFLEVKYFLEALLNAKVDLATERALHPQLKDNILKEALRVA
ncbi:MAG: nucleotidyltransferase family protein [Pseudomonadota bacterium]|nr:nucleotidyltransferase family protein [Pseudomonadota bacterium]